MLQMRSLTACLPSHPSPACIGSGLHRIWRCLTSIHSCLLPLTAAEYVQNLLDLAHAPFTHTSTFAKGWPIPDVVRFKAEQVMQGR